MTTGSGPQDPPVSHDARPLVGAAGRSIPTWAFVAFASVFGLLLVVTIEMRHPPASAPAIKAQASDLEPGPLAPPPLPIAPEAATRVDTPPVSVPAEGSRPELAPTVPRAVYVPQPSSDAPDQLLREAPAPPIQQTAPSVPPVATAQAPTLVIDDTAVAPAPPVGATREAAQPDAASPAAGGARASALRGRTTLVTQGTIIPAILETALDSTHPGFARAIVETDVRGFDGRQILIPRGSRLIGDYRADVQPGQNRIQVIWTQLVRPDGAGVAIESPATDALGGTGIPGRVNSHFLARFGGAILQSSLDAGVGLASRVGSGGSAVILSLPGALQGSAATTVGNVANQVRPTIKVKAGAAISVFVARELDFAAVGPAR